jgi:hypothetical protein
MAQIYSFNHTNFIDRIVVKKRQEMCDIINNQFNNDTIIDVLDIGSTNDNEYQSSNYIIKNLKNVKIFKSISDINITDTFFSKSFRKSITDIYTDKEISLMKSDLVISNATIEHVGNIDKQIRMIKNTINLSKKYYVIITPNRFHPIDFHTKLPIIHWLPKKLHRKILKLLNLDFFSKESNLNLLGQKEFKKILQKAGAKSFKMFHISLFGFKSNLIVIGEKNT